MHEEKLSGLELMNIHQNKAPSEEEYLLNEIRKQSLGRYS